MAGSSEGLIPGQDTDPLRRAAGLCLSAALRAADAAAAVRRTLSLEGERLRVGDAVFDLSAVAQIYVLGGGKASAPMAEALEMILGPRITAGVVSVKHGHGRATDRVAVREAGHPLPDDAGVRAATEILALAGRAGPEDLVLVVLSGGGSALLTAPAPGLGLADKLIVTDLLLRAGAPIRELNTVRRHLSGIKGGWLARRIAPAPWVTLVLSDVLGNHLDAIASGPTVPDPTTYADALTVLRARDVIDTVPGPVRVHLERGVAGQEPETPKPGDPLFDLGRTVIVGDLAGALAAAADAARGEGFTTVVLSQTVEGEAREAGAALGRAALRARKGGYGPRPVCLVQGGETTVTVRGEGRGGRNLEVALGAALEVQGVADALVVSAGTDGTDGPTDAAGAVADGSTVTRARRLGLDPHDALARNNTYPFFAALGDLVVTGPTLTNVNDVMLALVA